MSDFDLDEARKLADELNPERTTEELFGERWRLASMLHAACDEIEALRKDAEHVVVERLLNVVGTDTAIDVLRAERDAERQTVAKLRERIEAIRDLALKEIEESG